MNKKKEKTTEKKTKEEKVVKEKNVTSKSKNKEIKVKKTKKEKKPGIFKSILNFLKSVKSEMSKVVWPTKKDMIKYSIATVVFIVIFAVYFYGIEVLMAWLKSIIVVI